MSQIITVQASEILDSRGNPTVRVKVLSADGAVGIASVPSGASTGSKEALELRDKNTPFANQWFGGKGVQQAVNNVNEDIAALFDDELLFAQEQRKIDNLMIEADGTATKKNFGANAILGVSLAVSRVAAEEANLPLYQYLGGLDARVLPVPMLNVLNGGAHASNTVDFQEFMIMPLGFDTFSEALKAANKVFHTLAKILKQHGHGTLVGDEGGFAPNAKSHEEVLDYLVEAIKAAGFVPATSGKGAIAIALDAASSEFYDAAKQKYVFKKLQHAIDQKTPGFEHLTKVKLEFTTDELLTYYGALIEKYLIISIEDGFAEDDWEGFAKFTAQYGHKVQIVGDDLTVTNSQYLQKAIDTKAINSILIKLNQIGTLSETIDAIKLAQRNGLTAVISHRSGETEDTYIADLAVAFNTGQIKTGSLSRSDRVAKYNRLLEIEQTLGEDAVYWGAKTFYNLKK
ncbi:phosphopyruvate hydratase [Mycoplasmopsis columbinasalis]|uniref:Enolase n=1 Tax=Mycoplasmopsis columbinasalis TaxID=114880 RepID=A0A449B9H6_9BACT|nr:phosphopyruvate hydratase [Mycoplasmopsis columbinasalis]VEU77813.1 Enolase [Mycoplasmopsis columbinasalis]